METLRRAGTPVKRLCQATTLLAAVLVTTAHSQQEQKCDALVPAQGQIEYRWRENRCEGFYRSNVSSGDLELVSLLIGKLTVGIAKNAQLEIVAPTIQRSLGGPIHVRAVAIPPRTYYRMDAVLNPGTPLSWPVGDVLAPSQLSLDRIGVFGWVDGSPERVFVPVRVVPAGQAMGASGEQVELRVRSSSASDWMRWRAHIEGASPQDLPPWQDASKAVEAWKPVAIALPSDGAGILRVDVRAKPQNSDQTQLLSVRVARPELP